MTPRILCLTMTLGAFLANILSAEEVLTFSEQGKVTKLTYSTIKDLKVKAAAHLEILDKQIIEKKKASETVINPFRKDARIKYEQLIGERENFLQLEWKCPYWKKCDHCDGGNKTWWVGDDWLNSGPCSKCHGNDNFTIHTKPHLAPDIKEPCGISIRKLLGVVKSDQKQ